jgi:long-chain acyl-CoA synthetase
MRWRNFSQRGRNMREKRVRDRSAKPDDTASDRWRYIFNPDGDAADLLAYPSALVEGRIAGKYLLSREKLPDTVVVQGVKKMSGG